jgi:hypothetical protein
MPIVGQFGSLAGFGVFPGGSFESIATVTVGSGGASSIEFTSIPGGFQHVQIRWIARGTNASGGYPGTSKIEVNGDTTAANYANHALIGNGSSASATGNASSNSGRVVQLGGGQTNSSTFAAGFIDVLDYASTSKNKTMRLLDGLDLNGSGAINVTSFLWMSTSAITSIKIIPDATFVAPLAQHSTFALYGVRA